MLHFRIESMNLSLLKIKKCKDIYNKKTGIIYFIPAL